MCRGATNVASTWQANGFRQATSSKERSALFEAQKLLLRPATGPSWSGLEMYCVLDKYRGGRYIKGTQYLLRSTALLNQGQWSKHVRVDQSEGSSFVLRLSGTCLHCGGAFYFKVNGRV